MGDMKTQVGIIGAGPAGLLLSQLLDLNGIENIVLERQSAAYVLGRIRAGVLERGTCALLDEAGVGARMNSDGLVHTGIELCSNGTMQRVDLSTHDSNASVMVYGQTEITKDLMEARTVTNGQLIYEAQNVQILGLDSDNPVLRYTKDEQECEIACDFVAGCDGFHGVSRQSMPTTALQTYERVYPFGWLGLLSETTPVNDELIYVSDDTGFALCSMRSKTRSRYYLQCALDEKLDDWPEDRFWDVLKQKLPARLAETLETGPALEMSIAPLRGFVTEPMRHGHLFLAGDAVHIVPPTGAKGLNLAASDVRFLSRALIVFYKENKSALLDSYSQDCLRRVWKAQRFSWWMTSLLHRFPDASDYDRQLQLSELDYLGTSSAAQAALAENYVGLPYS